MVIYRGVFLSFFLVVLSSASLAQSEGDCVVEGSSLSFLDGKQVSGQFLADFLKQNYSATTRFMQDPILYMIAECTDMTDLHDEVWNTLAATDLDGFGFPGKHLWMPAGMEIAYFGTSRLADALLERMKQDDPASQYALSQANFVRKNGRRFEYDRYGYGRSLFFLEQFVEREEYPAIRYMEEWENWKTRLAKDFRDGSDLRVRAFESALAARYPLAISDVLNAVCFPGLHPLQEGVQFNLTSTDVSALADELDAALSREPLDLKKQFGRERMIGATYHLVVLGRYFSGCINSDDSPLVEIEPDYKRARDVLNRAGLHSILNFSKVFSTGEIYISEETFDQPDYLAMRELAVLQDRGLGGPRDPKKAAGLMLGPVRVSVGGPDAEWYKTFSRETIIEAQKFLQAHGLYNSGIDGIVGPGFEKAAKTIYDECFRNPESAYCMRGGEREPDRSLFQ